MNRFKLLLAAVLIDIGHLDTLILGQGKHSIRLPADVGLKTQM